jgi:integrase
MSKSTRSRRNSKPAKPYHDFPLFPHATRRWAKKIRGKLHYFGPWDDPQTALKKYLEQRDDLHAGRTPRVQGTRLTVRELCNRFLTSKRHLLDTREITARTWKDYYAACDWLIQAFGRTRLVADLAAEDFERLRATLAKRWPSPVTLAAAITRLRTIVKYAEGILERTIRTGEGLKRPSKKVLRKERAARAPRLFSAEQLRTVLAVAKQPFKTMLLLGINCAFGNTDISTLPIDALDLDGGWVNFPRPKTGVRRRCPLWPETVAALRESLAKRPVPKDEAHTERVFITRYGAPWVTVKVIHADIETSGEEIKDRLIVKTGDALGQEMTRALKAVGLRRDGLNFYALRHTFETIGGQARDQVAVDHIMGHVDESMAATYREAISDQRLLVVTDHVHGWLFADAAPTTIKLADVNDDQPQAEAAI